MSWEQADKIRRETVKPSKAAMELAWKVMACTNEVTIGVLIDLALADLLEKAEAFTTCEYGGKGCAAYDKPLCRTCAIHKALEPWKPK